LKKRSKKDTINRMKNDDSEKRRRQKEKQEEEERREKEKQEEEERRQKEQEAIPQDLMKNRTELQSYIDQQLEKWKRWITKWKR